MILIQIFVLKIKTITTHSIRLNGKRVYEVDNYVYFTLRNNSKKAF